MSNLIIIIPSIVSTLLICIGIISYLLKSKSSLSSKLENLQKTLVSRQELTSTITEDINKLIPLTQMTDALKDLKSAHKALKLELGRINITETEIDLIDTRLRELEEIERELLASSIETQEELKILHKKEQEIAAKNSTVKNEIGTSTADLDDLIGKVEENSQLQIQVDRMMSELTVTQSKIDLLTLQIESGNEQYIKLKERYNALDIEYAQLYEKFTEFENAKKEITPSGG